VKDVPDLFSTMTPPSVGPYTGAALRQPLRSGPLASPADPMTSIDAGEAHAKNGRLSSNCKVALQLVILYPGMTAVELFNAQGDAGAMQRHEMSRRLADLKNAGLVKQGEPRVCEFAGTKQVTWYLSGSES
jgi:predicted HTH transcriptional regulator